MDHLGGLDLRRVVAKREVIGAPRQPSLAAIDATLPIRPLGGIL
jgi:hypothetical protein